jgi:uncharacterized membrane protein YoaK (UPF0700 family)
MPAPSSLPDTSTLARDARHGPLPALLLLLTIVTGIVDAVSYLKLGHVFVANMTGNVVFLGFAAAGASDFSVVAVLAAVASFLAGALVGGRLGAGTGQHRGRFIALASYVQLSLVGVALVVSLMEANSNTAISAYALIVPLGAAMGLQNAAARRLGVPDLTTTVLTLTLTGLAADSKLAGGANPNAGRRLLATAAMLIGATVGALLIFHVGPSAALALAFVLLLLNASVGYRLSSSNAAWALAK